MHAVHRGPEPPGLPSVRKEQTPKWVAYYAGKRKTAPASQWGQFLGDLREPFSGFCGYCEREDKGEVEHLAWFIWG